MRLKQVVLNFMSNAVKYNREGGSVSVGCEDTGNGTFRISVTDNGPGISKAHVDELFEPFSRLGAEKSAVEGTGIGLTIAKRLVELMGGKIGVETTVGEGSVFWVELPTSRLNPV
jgi:signal transduction histidine kinase